MKKSLQNEHDLVSIKHSIVGQSCIIFSELNEVRNTLAEQFEKKIYDKIEYNSGVQIYAIH